jgi:hypothetical protein
MSERLHFTLAGNVRALRSVGDFIFVAPGDDNPIEILMMKLGTKDEQTIKTGICSGKKQ